MAGIDWGLQMELGMRLVFALLIGAGIGSERQWHNKPAGARTHSLVCLASALFMIISIYGFTSFDHIEAVKRDPARLAAQVLSGIGFIGAGVIWKEGFNIKGLTTATTIWLVSGLGLASGAGMYVPTLLTTVLAFVALRFFNVWENTLEKKRDNRSTRMQMAGIHLPGLRAELENIIQETIDMQVSGQPENVLISFSAGKNIRDPFNLIVCVKDDIIQLISLRLPTGLHGRGLGKAVCRTLVDWAAASGMKKIIAAGRSEDTDFWRKNGFSAIDPTTFVYVIPNIERDEI